MKFKRKCSYLTQTLLAILVFEAMLQLRVAKCHVDSALNITSERQSRMNGVMTRDPDNLFSSIVKIVNNVKNNVEPLLSMTETKKAADAKQQDSWRELERSDKVRADTGFGGHKNSTEKKIDISPQKVSENSTERPVATVDVWAEEWTQRLPTDNLTQTPQATTTGKTNPKSTNKPPSSADLSARTQKNLNYRETTTPASVMSSPKTGKSLTTKTWLLNDKHASLLPSLEDHLDDESLFEMTQPSARDSGGGGGGGGGESSTESSGDLSDNSLGSIGLQDGFKPLKSHLADNNIFEVLSTTPALPTTTKRQKSVKNRQMSSSGSQSFSPQYNAWKSEILNSKPSGYAAWPEATRTDRQRTRFASTMAELQSPDGGVPEEDNNSNPRKSWNNGGVYLRQVNPAQPQLQQSINDMIRGVDRGGTSRLEPGSVLLGSAASASSTAYGHPQTSSLALDSTANKYGPQRDLQNQPQTIQITAVPNGRLLNNQVVRLNGLAAGGLNALGFNPGVNTGMLPNLFAGGNGGGYMDAFGRQIVMVNAQRREIDWSFWIWPIIALVSLPLVLGALFVPIFLKSIVILIQVIQSLGLLLPFSLTQQLAQTATGVLAASQADQVKT